MWPEAARRRAHRSIKNVEESGRPFEVLMGGKGSKTMGVTDGVGGPVTHHEASANQDGVRISSGASPGLTKKSTRTNPRQDSL